MAKNEIGQEIFELIPETLQPSLVEHIKGMLLAQGEVQIVEKRAEMTADQRKAQISRLVDDLMPGTKDA